MLRTRQIFQITETNFTFEINMKFCVDWYIMWWYKSILSTFSLKFGLKFTSMHIPVMKMTPKIHQKKLVNSVGYRATLLLLLRLSDQKVRLWPTLIINLRFFEILCLKAFKCMWGRMLWPKSSKHFENLESVNFTTSISFTERIFRLVRRMSNFPEIYERQVIITGDRGGCITAVHALDTQSRWQGLRSLSHLTTVMGWQNDVQPAQPEAFPTQPAQV